LEGARESNPLALLVFTPNAAPMRFRALLHLTKGVEFVGPRCYNFLASLPPKATEGLRQYHAGTYIGAYCRVRRRFYFLITPCCSYLYSKCQRIERHSPCL